MNSPSPPKNTYANIPTASSPTNHHPYISYLLTTKKSARGSTYLFRLSELVLFSYYSSGVSYGGVSSSGVNYFFNNGSSGISAAGIAAFFFGVATAGEERYAESNSEHEN